MSMKITGVSHFATCRSMNDGDRCRFFRDAPPLMPGFKVNPAETEVLEGGECEEIIPPAGLGKGAHFVYRVEGNFLNENECAVFSLVYPDDDEEREPFPVAWLVQADETFTGVKAIKRVFGKHVDIESLNDPSGAIELMFEACDRLHRSFGIDYVFGVDGGRGMTFQSNNSDLISIHREAHETWQSN